MESTKTMFAVLATLTLIIGMLRVACAETPLERTFFSVGYGIGSLLIATAGWMI